MKLHCEHCPCFQGDAPCLRTHRLSIPTIQGVEALVTKARIGKVFYPLSWVELKVCRVGFPMLTKLEESQKGRATQPT